MPRGPEPASPRVRSLHCKYTDRLSRQWRSRKAAVGVGVDGPDVPLFPCLCDDGGRVKGPRGLGEVVGLSVGQFSPDRGVSLKVRTAFPAAAAKPSATPSSARATWPSASATPTSASPAARLTTGTARTCPARTAASSGAPRR